MKRIILSGGLGTRLHPSTLAVPKKTHTNLWQAYDLLSSFGFNIGCNL